MIVLIFAEIRPTKWKFESKAINNIELFPYGYPGSSLPILLNCKAAILKTEDRAVVFHKDRKNLLFFAIVFTGTPINKNIFLPVMPVDITTKTQLSLLFCFAD